MANKTCKLYIRGKVGYREPPKRLADLPEDETFVLFWYEGRAKKVKTVGRFADKAQTALINQEAALRRAAVTSTGTLAASTPASEPEKPAITGRDFLEAVNVYLSEVKRGKSRRPILPIAPSSKGSRRSAKPRPSS